MSRLCFSDDALFWNHLAYLRVHSILSVLAVLFLRTSVFLRLGQHGITILD